MKTKFSVLFAAVVMTFALAACGDRMEPEPDDKTPEEEQTETKKKKKKILSVQIGSNPETIDPALNSAADASNMLLHSHECLLTVNKERQFAPGQAESWESSEDGLTWTFHLRDGLKWSDGTDLTAEDFVYSWRRVCAPETAAPYAETVLGMVKGYAEAAGKVPDPDDPEKKLPADPDALAVEAPDPHTLIVTLANNYPYFASLTAFPALSPVHRKSIEENGEKWATKADTFICNGCFYISEWIPDSHIMMTKNPYYWNADAIKLDGIKFNLIADADASYSAYKTGEVLFIKDVPTEEIPSLLDNKQFHADPVLGTYCISMNTQKEPYNDAKFRKALSLAIDREYVAGTLMKGTYLAAPNFIGPGWADASGDFFANANGGKPYINIAKYEENLEEAKKLLAEAGYPNGEGLGQLTYSTNDDCYHKAFADYLKEAWGELGINLNVEVVEWDSFLPLRRAGDYEISSKDRTADCNDPLNQLELFYSTNENNDEKFNNPEFDAAIDVSRQTLDMEKRFAALHEAEGILMRETACIPVVYYNDLWLESEKVSGSWHSPYGYWYFMYADITE